MTGRYSSERCCYLCHAQCEPQLVLSGGSTRSLEAETIKASCTCKSTGNSFSSGADRPTDRPITITTRRRPGIRLVCGRCRWSKSDPLLSTIRQTTDGTGKTPESEIFLCRALNQRGRAGCGGSRRSKCNDTLAASITMRPPNGTEQWPADSVAPTIPFGPLSRAPDR